MDRIPLRGALVLAITGLLALPGLGQAQALTPQQRLMARRAAELDAYRKIAETINGISISSKTTVKDFVTESDEINSSFSTFIKGIKIVGDPVYQEDGTVEVTAAVTLEQVIRELKRVRQRHYIGEQYTEEAFDKIREFVKQKVITATGYGAPPSPKQLEQPDFTGKSDPPPPEVEAMPEVVERAQRIYKPSPTAGMESWNGVTGQGRLMAMRAAEVDAFRKLGETINGIRISSRTTVKDFVAENDEIKSSMQAFIQGTKLLAEPKYNEDGTVEVHAGVTLAQVIEQIQTQVKRHYKGNQYEDVTYKKVQQFENRKLIEATGAGAVDMNNPQHYMQGAQFTGWDRLVGPNARFTLMTIRSAQVVAQRRFAERTSGLQILSGTYVKDMVAESDEIRASTEAFIKGAKPVGDVVLYSDGVIEAQMGATWYQIIQQVESKLKATFANGQMTHGELMKRIKIFEKEHYFAERGYGALPSRAPFYGEMQAPPPPAPTEPDWLDRTIEVTGDGAPREGTSGPQAKLLARRAARLDAFRKLTEQVYGLKLSSHTTVKDFVTENDTIESATAAFIRGATEVSAVDNEDGTSSVTLSISLRDLYRVIGRRV